VRFEENSEAADTNLTSDEFSPIYHIKIFALNRHSLIQGKLLQKLSNRKAEFTLHHISQSKDEAISISANKTNSA